MIKIFIYCQNIDIIFRGVLGTEDVEDGDEHNNYLPLEGQENVQETGISDTTVLLTL